MRRSIDNPTKGVHDTAMVDTEADPSHPPPSTAVNFSPVGDEREKLIRELRTLPSPYAEREEFLRQCAVIAHGLPAPLLGAIRDFRAQTSDDGVLSIHALPADQHLIPTHSADSEVIKDKTTFFSESWLAILGLLLGEPYGFIQEGSGELFVNVYPTLKERELLSSKSSAITLDLHTEVAFHPAIPDYILLFCLRSDRELKGQDNLFQHKTSPSPSGRRDGSGASDAKFRDRHRLFIRE
ncbi:MAG: hypothetical protein V6Z86_00405 [Hyphomicrobiales bacterium]